YTHQQLQNLINSNVFTESLTVDLHWDFKSLDLKRHQTNKLPSHRKKL
ncbi:5850_t:CDS:1, partial [Entrophospora sp. SA101]